MAHFSACVRVFSWSLSELVIFVVALAVWGLPSPSAFAKSIQYAVVAPISADNYCPLTQLPTDGRIANLELSGVHGQYIPIRVLVAPLSEYPPLKLTSASVAVGDDLARAMPVNMRTIKCWYQGGAAWRSIHHKKGRTLVPELLLRDESLVRVDRGAKENYIRVARPGHPPEYIASSKLHEHSKIDRNGRIPHKATEFILNDSESTEPIPINGKQLIELWILAKIPTEIAAGRHSAVISIEATGDVLFKIPIAINVYGFELLEPRAIYSVYYRALLNEGAPAIISDRRTIQQMTSDLTKMRTHGIATATLYQSHRDEQAFKRVIRLRKESGISVDPLFYLNTSLDKLMRADKTSAIETYVERTLRLAKANGIEEVYFYGIDEAKDKGLKVQQKGWGAIRKTGGKIFTAGRQEHLEAYAGMADVFVTAYAPDESFASHVRSKGTKVFAYAYPQVGVENPLAFRLHYGLELWRANYDGAMLYAYQDSFGSAWDDTDGKYRDHLFTYPTTAGSIDTLAWEGLREAIYDARYLETLQHHVVQIKNSGEECSSTPAVLRAISLLENVREGRVVATLDELRDQIAETIASLGSLSGECSERVNQL